MSDAAHGSAGQPQPRSILIVRLSAMGDIIHTLPAATLLRHAFPDAKLGWLVEERWSELLCTRSFPRSGPRSAQRPLVDQVHTVNLVNWRRALLSSKTWLDISLTLRNLRNAQYDTVIDFQGAIRSALLARASRAPRIIGSSEPREAPARMFYTQKITLIGSHVVEQALAIAAAMVPVNVPQTSAPQVEFPVDPVAEEKISTLIKGLNGFAILNPGAGWGAKRWPAERYAEVAKQLAGDGLTSFINYGPGEEELATTVESDSNGAARKISCSISELISLTRRASLFIGGDTGPTHMAAAMQVPVVAIFGPTNPARNGPFGTPSIVLRSSASVTDHTRHHEPEQGLLGITVGEVAAAARELLAVSH